ncbi:MAG: hypothetical protein AAFZ18_25405 [Myxococcota bacterium]
MAGPCRLAVSLGRWSILLGAVSGCLAGAPGAARAEARDVALWVAGESALAGALRQVLAGTLRQPVRLEVVEELSPEMVLTPPPRPYAELRILLDTRPRGYVTYVIADDARDRLSVWRLDRVEGEDDVLIEQLAEIAAGSRSAIRAGEAFGEDRQSAAAQVRRLGAATTPGLTTRARGSDVEEPYDVAGAVAYRTGFVGDGAWTHGPWLGLTLSVRDLPVSLGVYAGYLVGSPLDDDVGTEGRLDTALARLDVALAWRTETAALSGRLGAGLNLVIPALTVSEPFANRSSVVAQAVVSWVIRGELRFGDEAWAFVDLGADLLMTPSRYLVEAATGELSVLREENTVVPHASLGVRAF